MWYLLIVASVILAPSSKCSLPGSFEDETLLICIIYIQEKVHQSIPNADTGLPWCTWCWNSSLVYSFNIKLQVSGSSWWGGVVWFSCTVTSEEYWNSLTFDEAVRPVEFWFCHQKCHFLWSKTGTFAKSAHLWDQKNDTSSDHIGILVYWYRSKKSEIGQFWGFLSMVTIHQTTAWS